MAESVIEEESQLCTHCGSPDSSYCSQYVDKNGTSYNNYKCNSCGRNFSMKPRKFSFAQKKEAIDVFLETGSNLMAARHLNCSGSQIIRWRREFVRYGQMPETAMPVRRARKPSKMVAE
jgi:transposase-like protein